MLDFMSLGLAAARPRPVTGIGCHSDHLDVNCIVDRWHSKVGMRLWTCTNRLTRDRRRRMKLIISKVACFAVFQSYRSTGTVEANDLSLAGTPKVTQGSQRFWAFTDPRPAMDTAFLAELV